MTKPLTAADRRPRPGDRLQTHYDGIVTIYDIWGGCPVVSTGRGLTRLGWTWIEGGWKCSVANGSSPRGWYFVRPAIYIFREDRGPITHPLDSGAWV